MKIIEYISKEKTRQRQINDEKQQMIGKYSILPTFEVIHHGACGDGSDALLGKGDTEREAITILNEKTATMKLIGITKINGKNYYEFK